MQKKYEADPDFKHYDNYGWEKLEFGDKEYEKAREEDRQQQHFNDND